MIEVRTDRLAWVDRLRGLAVALMVLDHALIHVDPTNAARYTVTRLALPLFMLCAGVVWRPGGPSLRRWAGLGAVVAFDATVSVAAGLQAPAPVTVFVIVLLIARVPVITRWPLTFAVIGLCQSLWLSFSWGGYDPGYLLLFFLLGRLCGAVEELHRLGDLLPRWLAHVGRRPLTWYCGHLAALAVVVAL